MKKICVIIVLFNGIKWIRKCLESVKNSSFPLDCIVVDNASNDGSFQVVQDEFPWVNLVEMEKNLGFGKANNWGIKNALSKGYDAVLLLNQDAFIYKDTIKNMLEFWDENALMSPLHFDGSGLELDYKFKRYIKSHEKETIPFEVNFVNAAFWLVSRKMIENVGVFNPMFDHYGEDENYVQRVHYHNYYVKVIPSARICHDRKQVDSRKFDFLYLKTYFLVDALNVLKDEKDILVLKKIYWLKFLLYAIKDFVFGRFTLAKDKWNVFLFYYKARKELLFNRKKASCLGAFLDD